MDWHTPFFSAVSALVGAALGTLLTSWLTFRREQRLAAWRKELERFLALEELAGILIEFAGSYGQTTERRQAGQKQMEEFSIAAGRFARYGKVRQAIRDLHNTLARQLASGQPNEDKQALQREAEARYQDLLQQCDEVMGGRVSMKSLW